MIITTKKNWVNGHQVRAGWFNTFTLSFLNIGIMFIWGREPKGSQWAYNAGGKVAEVKFYKLI